MMQGLSKQEMTVVFIAEAEKLGRKTKSMENLTAFMRSIWIRPVINTGWALTSSGSLFLSDILELNPYPIDCNIPMTSRMIVAIDTAMPYPYRLDLTGAPTHRPTLIVFSQEVAVWAALYDKDLLKLIEAYNAS